MNKRRALEQIAEQIASCKICKSGKIGEPVPGEGNPDADIVFLGEAPGKQEAETGRPFIGRSGQLLRSLIRAAGIKEEDVYITSPVKYLPKRGTPTGKDIAHGRIHLFQQLEVIEPKIIVLLGRVAAEAMLEKVIPVIKMHGTTVEKNNRTYFLTLHPAAALRNPPVKPLLLEDFEKLKNIISI